MNLFSLFSGIGAFEKALDNLKIPYELTGFSEIDKYAIKSYCAIHNVEESKNYGDITKIDENALPKNIDLITYGFPCQDISLAGKQKGLFNNDGTQTRSGLFFEALRIIEATKPRIAIAENVKNLTSKKFAEQFKIVLDSLEEAGYNNYWQVLNAKDYGIPQNRERVFIVSIRKDIDTGSFKFPEGFPLELRLKDMLEAEVDEKFYLDKEQTGKVKIKNPDALLYDKSMIGFEDNAREYNDIMPTITSREWKEPRLVNSTAQMVQVGQIYGTEKEPNPQAGRIYDAEGISPTMDSCSGGNRMPKVLVRETEKVIGVGNVNPCGRGQNGQVIDAEGLARTITTEKGEGQKILIREATKKGYAEAVEGDSINLEQPNSKTRRGRVGHGVAQTLTTSPAQGVVVEPRIEVLGNYSPSGHDASRIVHPEGLAPTVKENHGTVTATIQRVDIPQTVKVRKYPVDTESLCETLRHHKALQNLTNQGIAEELDVPVTKVEHWFRKDECFAIPDAEIWYALKNLLKIETNEFDRAIMVFEEKEGVFEKSERHYLSDGIAPTLTSATASEKVIEPSLRIRKLTPKECFRLMGFDDADFEKAEAVNSNTQLYKQAGNSIVVPVVEYIIKELIACGALESEGTIQKEPTAPTQPIMANTVTFSAKLTAAELSSLNHYMKTRKIEYQIV